MSSMKKIEELNQIYTETSSQVTKHLGLFESGHFKTTTA